MVMVVVGIALGVFSSPHGPSQIMFYVGVNICVAISVFWGVYVYLKSHPSEGAKATLFFWGVGLLVSMVVSIFLSWGFLVEHEYAQMQEIEAKTNVTYLGDEVLLSSKGNPIGVRIKYSIIFPASGYAYQNPFLQALNNPVNNLAVSAYLSGNPDTVKSDPPASYIYEAGKVYVFTADIEPTSFFHEGSSLCLRKEMSDGFRRVNGEQLKTRFSIAIHGTDFHGETVNEYSLESFYESFVQEGMVECSQ
jgi:small basic protein